MWKKREPLYTIDGNINLYSHYKHTQSFIKNFSKIELLYHPAILLLGIYAKNFKSGSQRDICSPMFIAALFTVTKHRSNLNVHQQVNG